MVAKCRQVVRNPFSTATNQPKLPDGKANSSMGGKRHCVGTIDFGEVNTMDIIISPRADTPIFWSSAKRNANDGNQFAVAGKGDFADNHPLNRAFEATGSTTQIKQNDAAEISRWRLVSQGCKLTLTNSTDDNDGWFEAFRFVPKAGTPNYISSTTAGSPIGISTVPRTDLFGNRPLGTTAQPITADFDMNLASKGQYVTGKLRNLHRYVWTNRPHSNDVEFKSMAQELLVASTSVNAGINPNNVETAFHDNDYDVIWIRVHGRGIPANAQGGCCLPTRLMFHVCQNVETIFSEQNLLHSFMTKAPTGSRYTSYGTMMKRPTRKKTYKKRKTTKKK